MYALCHNAGSGAVTVPSWFDQSGVGEQLALVGRYFMMNWPGSGDSCGKPASWNAPGLLNKKVSVTPKGEAAAVL